MSIGENTQITQLISGHASNLRPEREASAPGRRRRAPASPGARTGPARTPASPSEAPDTATLTAPATARWACPAPASGAPEAAAGRLRKGLRDSAGLPAPSGGAAPAKQRQVQLSGRVTRTVVSSKPVLAATPSARAPRRKPCGRGTARRASRSAGSRVPAQPAEARCEKAGRALAAAGLWRWRRAGFGWRQGPARAGSGREKAMRLA